MGGPFMVEIVFCRVTRRGRKKKAGMNKLARENCRNDGPMGGGFIPPDTLKITLDLSDSGPVFGALDDMMMKMMEDDEKARIGGRTQDSSAAKNALKKLLKSGIPGIEAMFGAEDPTPKFGKKGGGKKGFHKMTDASKKKFMNAIFGEEGTQIDSSTAAALLAATCSGGNADIGNKLAELLMPELDEKVDPAMMAALMAACSVIQTGANTEEVLNIMKLELAASGLSEEEILEKAKLLMRAFGKEEAGSTAEFMLMSKQTNAALVQAGLPPKDFTSVRCSLEDVADNMISSLCARGEKTARIIGQVTETLKNTGATAHVVATTLMPPLVEMTGESEASLIRTISRNLKEVEYEPEDVKSAITELVLKIIDNDMSQYVDAVKALEDSLKDMGLFANEIQEYIKANIPSPPTPPEEIERRAQMAAELARLELEEEERARLKALKDADPGAYDREMRAKMAELKESDPAAYEAEMKKMGKTELDRLLSKSDSRRGSLLPGQTRSRAGSIVIGTGSRRGSCLDTNRATVAMVTDDPEHKSAMREGLAGAFGEQESAHSAVNGFASAAGGGGGGAGVAAGVAAAAAAAGVDTATQQKLQKLAQSDPVAYEKEMKKLGAAALASVDPATQERLAKLKESDPAAYEKELKKLGAAVAAGAPGVGGAAGAGGAVGAAGAGGAGGAGGVLAGAGGAAAGVAGAAAVAGVDKATKDKLQKMKESDPAAYEAELKKIGAKAVANLDKATQERLAKLKASDPAAYEKELKKLGSVAAAGGQPAGGKIGQQVASNGLNGGVGAGGGSLPAGTKVEAGADGRVTVGGAKLPPGATVVNNPDGSKSISVTAEQEELVAKMLASGMDEATAYQYLQQLCGVAGKGKTLCNVGGAASFRTAEESVENAKEILNAFDRAILKHKNRPKIEVPKLTPEAKALMEQILASNGSKEEIASRVEALLAGSELSSSRGMNGGFDGTNLSEARSGKLDMDSLARPGQQGSLADRIRARNAAKQQQQSAHGSVKRQSEIQREKKKSRQEEREEEKLRKASYYRKVTGLRRAKVPMMVYSCGGFSRCFRVCRFYDVEGPPVGVEYEAPTPVKTTRNL